MGLTWALAWFGAGVALLLVVGVDAADVPFPLGFGLLGFFAGAIFSGVLSIVEGRRDFEQLSLPRLAGWGAVGGLLLSVVFVLAVAMFGNDQLDLVVLGPVFAVAGAASAAGSLALARGAEQRELLDGGANRGADGLAEGDARELFGGRD